METIVYEVELNDGRTFRIFAANSTQKQKIVTSSDKFKHLIKNVRVITNGIHTTKQWLKISETLIK